MVKLAVLKKIDKEIKVALDRNIPKDFDEGFIINENYLKISLCYHLWKSRQVFCGKIT